MFLWTVVGKLDKTMEWLHRNDLRVCEVISWVKRTVNGKLIGAPGRFMKRDAELCIVGVTKNEPTNVRRQLVSTVIEARRDKGSRKPVIFINLLRK